MFEERVLKREFRELPQNGLRCKTGKKLRKFLPSINENFDCPCWAWSF